jgi:hypothetical protein
MNFSTFRDYAFLSQASYRGLAALLRNASAQQLEVALSDPDPNVLSPQNRFADAQAKMLTGSNTANPTDGYTFLHQAPNGPRGFSASVFASNDGGRAVIAIRGTELDTLGAIVNDVLDADVLGLVLRQAAYGQLADAYRYYKQLITPQNPPVQYSEAERTELQRLYAFHFSGQLWSAISDTALLATISATMDGLAADQGLGDGAGGPAIDPSRPIELTGHSLGGHLAMVLGDMVARHRGGQYVGGR